ncbi:MAG TPA: TetR family transcriptional regulator [Gemmatimonadaceae bacterium]|jgi:AcrR family transcriptional regulator|nr:TetR family transcriptional regulator [Gemmatimonadaceae bacterium]
MNPASPAPDRLLAAARDLFRRHGYDGTSVRDLTARAHVNLGAVTYYFGSKQALYHATLSAVAEPFAERIAEAARQPGPPLDRIVAALRAGLAYLGEHPEAPAFLFRELASDRALPAPIARLMKRNVGTLAALVREGQRDGSIRDGDPVLLALSAISQAFFLRSAARIIRDALDIDPQSPRQWARVVDHVAESVRRTLDNHQGISA